MDGLAKRDVWIVDVAPRDGLQNDPAELGIADKVELVRRLLGAGVYCVEVGSFVSSKRVPKMADTDEVVRELGYFAIERCTCLIPNERGYDRARLVGLKDVRTVVAASSTMNRKNFNCEVEETFDEICRITSRAQAEGVKVGAVIGTAFGCPYEGTVPAEKVLRLVEQLVGLGVQEILLADTTGMAVPVQVAKLCEGVLRVTDGFRVWVGIHLHNTRNAGYANAFAAWQSGITLFDASLGGIGGCPFAPKATGNIATEDLAHMLERSGVQTGIDLEALIHTSSWLAERLGHEVPSLLPKAGLVPAEVYKDTHFEGRARS
jgi:(R)-citramalyl-CoA lyase